MGDVVGTKMARKTKRVVGPEGVSLMVSWSWR
jgi:aminoglycoside N3'-acetyltransferase